MTEDENNNALCAHYGAPMGSPCPHIYNTFGQDILNYENIHKSGPTLTELGYTKLEIIRNSAAAILIGLSAAALIIALIR
ncbi:MAG: hypothetical protein JHD10_11135 [Sphingomonadaceae bacterium]|nr:hypothetical protein [Sphingomonadaceae bacterium]